MNGPIHGEFEKKIKTIPELIDIANQCRREGKIIVYCHGVFDILHAGHVHHFEQAKRNGDVLIVTLTADEFVGKGEGRPLFGEELRLIMMASLEVVDLVSLNKAPDAVEMIRALMPHIYAKGADSTANPTEELKMEIKAVEEMGGKVIFTPSLPIHSTHIIHEGEPISLWKTH